MVASASQGPLVVIVGATGGQGGSFVTHLLASDRPYRLRGITRDAKQEASLKLVEQGVEIAEADTAGRTSNKRSKELSSFSAITVIDYWQFLDVDKSIANGKLIVDAVKEAGVKLLVWSGLESTQRAGKDEKERVGEWDAKTAVADYARAEGVPISVVESGCPMSNFASSMGPKRQPDGAIVFSLPIPSNTIISLLNTSKDFGAFARLAMESTEFGAGANVLACAEELTLVELVQQWNEVTGKQATYIERSVEDYLAAAPPAVGRETLAMMRWYSNHGNFGREDVRPSQAAVHAPLTSWREFVKEQNWSRFD